MKPLRRICWILTFLIFVCFLPLFILLTPIEWVFTGKIVLVENYCKIVDKILDYINPANE